jgi:hypothetical protein
VPPVGPTVAVLSKSAVQRSGSVKAVHLLARQQIGLHPFQTVGSGGPAVLPALEVLWCVKNCDVKRILSPPMADSRDTDAPWAGQ